MYTAGQLTLLLVLQSCIIPHRRFPRVSGGDFAVSGPPALGYPYWLAKWSRSVLHAQMSRRQNWFVVTGFCRQPKLFCCRFRPTPSYVKTDIACMQRYLSLFCIYTPYTIYQCELCWIFGGRNPPTTSQMGSAGGQKSFGKTAGNVSCILSSLTVSRLPEIWISDFVLAACDVEGNFLVVKVSDSRTFTIHSGINYL